MIAQRIFLLLLLVIITDSSEAFHSSSLNVRASRVTTESSLALNIKQPWHPSRQTKESSMKLAMARRRPSWMTPSGRTTAVYALILTNITVFLIDKIWKRLFIRRHFYLFHRQWHWWQLLTNCFCHIDRAQLSMSLFLLLLFGRSVEDDMGWRGLLCCYAFCGILSSVASLLLLPKSAVTIGASGAIFGLYTATTLVQLASTRILDWRRLLDFAIMGEFVFRQYAMEGGIRVANLYAAGAGALLILGIRSAVDRYEARVVYLEE